MTTCPHCRILPLHRYNERTDALIGTVSAPECDVDGAFFPDVQEGEVVACIECGEVTAHDVVGST